MLKNQPPVVESLQDKRRLTRIRIALPMWVWGMTEGVQFEEMSRSGLSVIGSLTAARLSLTKLIDLRRRTVVQPSQPSYLRDVSSGEQHRQSGEWRI